MLDIFLISDEKIKFLKTSLTRQKKNHEVAYFR
jgi:hypothetical protein